MRSTSVAAQRGKMFFQKFVVPFIEFVCALGGSAYFYTGNVGRVHANGALGIGVSPASNLTTNLPQSVVTTYDKIFVENLKAETPWVRTTSRRSIDENSGNRLVLYMYQNLPAPPLTQAPEGTIQTGLTATVVSNTSIMGNYADYMNISTYALQTAIDPALEALGVQMAYRMAQVINLILQNTADGAAIVDPSSLIEKAADDPLTSDDVIIASQSLTGVNALPFEGGRFTGVIHPHIVGDILLDKSNNGLTDVLKRTPQGNERLMDLPSADGQTVPLIDWGGVSFFQSTLVKQTPNYDETALTALRTYIVGRDGLIGVSFGAKENTQIGNGDWRNLAIWVRRLSEPSGYDPSRMIGGFASYNTMYTATLPPDPVQRIRMIDAVSAIT